MPNYVTEQQPRVAPQQTVKLGNGLMVPAQQSFRNAPNRPKKFLVVLQYWEGDRNIVEDLGSLIADLERVRNRGTDVMIFGRPDAQEFDRTVVSKLEAKFDRVHVVKSRRKGANNYPFAANEMFYDLVTLLAQFSPWKDDYFAFINLEGDCTPLHPGWISELVAEFRAASVAGFVAVGHHQPSHPVPHMNGVAVYDINLWRLVGAGKLNGGNPRVAYDIHHAKTILPVSQDTPYITLDFQRATISPEDLFRAHKSNVEPAIFHGVKDSSARDAVRAKHITFSDMGDVTRRTVMTYFHNGSIVGAQEHNAILAQWREGWASKGWNPVVIGLREASQNPRFAQVMEAVKRLPGYAQPHRYARWLALEKLGGGFLTDYDVLPGNFTPGSLKDVSPIASFAGVNDPGLTAAQFPRTQITQWVDLLENYDAKPGEDLVTDRSVFEATFQDPINEDRYPTTKLFGSEGWREARLVHFSNAAVMRHGAPGERKSTAMAKYLRGE